jgi:hypothetical protein
VGTVFSCGESLYMHAFISIYIVYGYFIRDEEFTDFPDGFVMSVCD